jgi:enamine deaminase RidA (YjgF/YER057c/UK114 family)
VPQIAIFNPAGLAAPLGPYSHIARVTAAEFVFIAGQVSVDAAGNLIGGHVVQFTTYLVHSQDIGKFMAYRGREFPRFFPSGAYPPNTLLIVDRLVQEALLVEVQAIAAL